MMTKALYRPVRECRLCGAKEVTPTLDLGQQALTGIFPKSKSQEIARGPLQLGKCERCHLVQLLHNYDLSQLYGETYGYRSGLNASMVRHLHQKVQRIRRLVTLGKDDLVIDIGANDSTLLQAYGEGTAELVGIDPSGRKFAHHYPPHIALIPEFFASDLINRRYPGRRAKVVTSIAMFYDLEQPMAFVQEVADALAQDGLWVFEQSYLPFMLDTTSYDTVCHEHLEYYALKQVKRMLDAASLKIVDLEFNDVNGGSFSVAAAKRDAPYHEASDLIARTLEDELRRGLDELSTYEAFAERTRNHRSALLILLQRLKNDGKRVLGYGASTKGNVLIQYCGIDEKLISGIAEVNEDKFGAFTPGSRIPIISEPQARADSPDYFIVFPWHFKAGILQREAAFLRSGGRFIFPLPSLEIVSASGTETVWRA
jgi:hypothetical protein